MDNQLTSKGWHLSGEGLKACQVACGKESPTVNDIIKIALNCDLRQIAKKRLPENINSGQTESINGPIVLQVQKIRNVSAPLANQDSKGAPRMIKLNLTDGCSHCVAIEFDSVSVLNMNLIPGTKVCLIGSEISVMKGCILLDGNNIKVLGGEVEVLKTKWEASKQVSVTKRYGKANDDPPPVFTEFDSSKTRGPRSTQKRNSYQDNRNKDERSKDLGSKQSKRSFEHKEKAPEEARERSEPSAKKENYASKKDSNESKKDYNESRKGTEENHNVNKKEDQNSDFARNNTKNEYKSLWNGKKSEGSYKEDDKKAKGDTTYKDKKTTDKDKQMERRDSKSNFSSSNNYKDKERADSRSRGDTRNGEKRDQQKTVDREKKPSQDYRVREKKISSERWGDTDEYDRKTERKKDEKDLWSDAKSKEDKDSRNHGVKGSNDYRYNERVDKSKETRNSYRNDKEPSKDGRHTNKEDYPDRRDQRGPTKFKNDRDDKRDGGDYKKGDTRIKTAQNDRNSRNYSNDKSKRDFDKKDDYDSKYDKNTKEQTKDFKGKDQLEYGGDKKGSRDDAGRKPVSYDAQSQNWFYDGEMKNKRDDSRYDDSASSFKDSRYGKKDNSSNRPPLKDRNDYSESKPHYKKNSKDEYYDDAYYYRDNDRYSYNKKDQKKPNSKMNGKNFPDNRDKTDKTEKGKQNKQFHSSYSRDGGYDSYNKYKNDRSSYNRDGFQSRRQLSDDSHSSKHSKAASTGSQGQNYIDEGSIDNEHFKSAEESNSKYSPGKRIPLEILFGKTPENVDDNNVANMDNASQVSNEITPDSLNNYQTNNPYGKLSTKEIMERSLEQGQNQFGHLSQDFLYMQYPNINQLNQEIPYPYQQTMQPLPNFQVPPTSQYLGYNEHPGGGGSGGSAAVAGALNPYLSFPNPRNTFQYNPPMHTQHQTLQQQLPQQQQTQTLGNDIPYYSNNPSYYYPVGNTQMAQLPEQYQ